jgi:hypothetical protein
MGGMPGFHDASFRSLKRGERNKPLPLSSLHPNSRINEQFRSPG